MKKYFIICLLLSLCSCSSREIAIVVDKPVIPVNAPAEVESPVVSFFVTKDSEDNTLYSFDENNFIKLKKFLLDITRNNELSREIICFYNEDICSTNSKSLEKSLQKK